MLYFHNMPTKDPVKLKSKRARIRTKRTAIAKLRRQAWFELNGPCKCCGSTVNLEIDHIIPHKTNNHRNLKIFLRPKLRQDAELAQCQVLCCSCHRAKSGFENRKFEHGLNLYNRHGCRCQICKAANAMHKRLQRARKSSKNCGALKGGLYVMAPGSFPALPHHPAHTVPEE